MSTIWTINGETLEELGLEIVSYDFRAFDTSTVAFNRATEFDADTAFSHGEAIVLKRDGQPFFQGRVARAGHYGNDQSESQKFTIEDAWADLERTTYQEQWIVGSSVVYLPTALLGISSAGLPIGLGTQIRAVVQFAITQGGVNLQIGTIPNGPIVWPTEAKGTSCAEVIRSSLKYLPSWVPRIDHSTTPPTFHVTTNDAAAMTIDVSAGDEVVDFEIIKREDMIPDAVRIIYTSALMVDDSVYRDVYIDHYPPSGPSAGPQVLNIDIDLAGGNMQIQKQRIQTRQLPSSQADAKAWIIKKYPHMKDVPASHFNVTSFSKVLAEETEAEPPPINPRATRIVPTSALDLPRELVQGGIEDWMRVKVGRVVITMTIEATSSATEESRTAIEKGTPAASVVATNATTKLYRGLTQWEPPESVPVGVAESFYNSMREGRMYEGAVTIEQEDIGSTRYVGQNLNLAGGRAEWAAMKAPIHSEAGDIGTGTVTITFGPPAYLAPQDFLELQKQMRARPAIWMSAAERTGGELGSELTPSKNGDTVTPYWTPETIIGGGEGGGESTPLPFQPVISTVSGGAVVRITTGIMRRNDTGAGIGISGLTDEFGAADNRCVYLEAELTPEGEISGVTARCQANWDGYPKKIKFATAAPYAQQKAYVELGRIGSTGDSLAVFNAWASGHMLLVRGVFAGRLCWEFRGGN